LNRLLIVDDEQSMRDMLSIALGDEGYEIVQARDGEEALRVLDTEPVQVVVSDIRMPGLDGLELLRRSRESAPHTDVILITAHASTDSAIEALRLGAYDYVTKPFDVEELKITVRHAMERRALQRENELLRSQLSERHGFDDLVGRSAAMERVFELIQRVKDSSSTVLIIGESGTGKELVARAIHYNGARAEAPFVAVNCAALPAQLLESELFGHVKGAFTGADRHKEGLFEAAEGGTILLDEIGDMPLELQPKLLRVLEDRKVRRVGATADTPIEVRVLAATNQDLRAAIAAGRFREDLYYRLNVIQVDLPPLRERVEDVLLLARHFLVEQAEEARKEISGFAPEAERLLASHGWPGNVRELVNAVRHAVTMETGPVIEAASLPASVGGERAESGGDPAGPRVDATDRVAAPSRTAAGPAEAVSMLPADGVDLESMLDDLKRTYMLEALSQANGVQTRAAELLGMSFRSFRYYAKKLGIGDGVAE
jgi:two-component system response regulator PilR (NtrC family)